MKKIISCIVAVISMLTMNVFAAEPEVNIVGNTVTFDCTTESNATGTVIVVKAGEDINNNDNIFAVKRAVANEEGVMTFSFNMPGDYSSEGDYDLYIKCGNDEIIPSSFTYITEQHRNTLYEDITGYTDTVNSAELVDIFDNVANRAALKVMGFDMTSYDVLKAADDDQNTEPLQTMNIEMTSYNALEAEEKSYRQIAFDIYLNDIKDMESYTESDVVSILNSAMIVELINISDSENAKGYIEKLNPSDGDLDYVSITDASMKAFAGEIIKLNTPYVSKAGVNKGFAKSNALYSINNARFNNIESVLSNNAEKLEITSNPIYLRYLYVSNKTKTNDNIATNLKSKPAKSVEALMAVIDTSIENSPAPVGGNPGVKKGGGVSLIATGDKTDTVKPAQAFSDIADVPWAAEAINALSASNVISGDGAGNFLPHKYVTREEFVKMIILASGLYSQDAKCSFDDIPEGEWFYGYVASACDLGIVFGINDNMFGLGHNILRQDMAVICCRALELKNNTDYEQSGLSFGDADTIGEYAVESVAKMRKAGIINGDDNNRFNPLSNTTRAEAAVVIYNAFFNLMKPNN